MWPGGNTWAARIASRKSTPRLGCLALVQIFKGEGSDDQGVQHGWARCEGGHPGGQEAESLCRGGRIVGADVQVVWEENPDEVGDDAERDKARKKSKED